MPAELITAKLRAVNRMMPKHVQVYYEICCTNRVPAGEGRVLFLGWSYKAGVGDARETPAELLANNLNDYGISVSTWDPYLTIDDIPKEINVLDDLSNAREFDMVVLATAHRECIEIDWNFLLENANTHTL